MINKKILKKFLKKFYREVIVFTFFLWFLFLIIKTVFLYTIIDWKFYQEKAVKQHSFYQEKKAIRWEIKAKTLDWEKSLAISTIFYNFSIDPTEIWDEKKFVDFFTDIVYEHLCEFKKDSVCKKNLLSFLKKDNFDYLEDFYVEEDFIKQLIRDWLKEKLKNKKLTSVLIKTDLTNEEKQKISSLWLSWVYTIANNLYFNPEKIVDRKIVAQRLSNIFSESYDDIYYMTRKRKRRYLPILKKISAQLKLKIEEFQKEEKSDYKKWIIQDKKLLIWDRFIIEPQPTRFYWEEDLASQVVGFTDNSWEWHYWIEWYYNKILKWKSVKVKMQKDSRWKILGYRSFEKEETIPWKNIKLTIDLNVQEKVEEILKKWVKKYNANKWTIIVVNPKNGNIIAMANYPTFNPNHYSDALEIEKLNLRKYKNPMIALRWVPILIPDKKNWTPHVYKWKTIYLRKTNDLDILLDTKIPKYKYKNNFGAWVYMNEAIASLYEPWSIMKAITVAIWIETWEITPDTYYMDKWYVKIDRFKITNVMKACSWYHTYAHALNYSCNVWMIDIARKVWKTLFYNYLKKFWFAESTNITLSWEVFWVVKPFASRANLFTSSYWLWVNVSPLQMVMAYATIANGWILYKPKIVDSISYFDKNTKKEIVLKEEPEIVTRVIKKSTSKQVIKMLVDSVNKWVAKHWKVPWYLLAWKTWTSDIASRGTYEKWVWSTNASFAGFGPAQDPKFVILVKLRRPRTVKYGWESSAFMFAELSKYLLDYYGISANEKFK